MKLKKLELKGFKSFPDQVELDFDSGITGVVGPNGSGKSNISDAIRWVMGEQNSRQLRGAKMEDVIFGGTEKRSPMGFAQVTLVINNTSKFPCHIELMDETGLIVLKLDVPSGVSEVKMPVGTWSAVLTFEGEEPVNYDGLIFSAWDATEPVEIRIG